MTSSGDEKPQIELSADEDWKTRVKEEDARLDAEQAGTAAAAPEPPPSDQPEIEPPLDMGALPPADFSMLVQMFSTQAIVALGMIPGPDGRQQQHLPLARHFIDLLGVLETKCQGNLSPEESKLLDNSLHELRIAYLEISQS